MKSKKMFPSLVLLALVIISFTNCTKKKGDSTSNVTLTTTVNSDSAIYYTQGSTGNYVYLLDQAHTGFFWEVQFMDLSNTFLTGKFNNYGFSSFQFNPNDLSSSSFHFWVDLSTFNTGQPGRDGNGDCGRSYVGVTYLDSAKTKIDSSSIWAYYDAAPGTITRSGNGYVVNGTMTLNRYLNHGSPNGQVTAQIPLYFVFNEYKDMGGTPDQHRFGFSGHLTFNRSIFMDTMATVQYVPVPTMGTTNLSSSTITSNLTAINNKTYGAWSSEVGDSCWVYVNPVFYINY